MADDKILTQLSIFINNEPGSLSRLACTLRDCSINLKAFNLAESSEFGILRSMVDDPDAAVRMLAAKNILARKTEVIGIKIKDVPGALDLPAGALGKAGINIEYGYAYKSGGTDCLFIRVDDTAKAIEVLEKAGIVLVSRSEI